MKHPLPRLLILFFLSAIIPLRCVHAEDTITSKDQSLWVGQFNQCSYNALASVLTYFYGPTPKYANRNDFQQETFFQPLKSTGYGAYFGWAPWTSYMVNSGKIVWDDHPVTDLVAQRFSLATKELPQVLNMHWIDVKYTPGEKKRLIDKLMTELKKGPVIIWTPYAAALGPKSDGWKSIVRVSEDEYKVPFSPSMTHSVTLFLRPDNQILVTDCSMYNGVFLADPATVVSVAASMSASVRIRMGDQPSIFQRGLKGVKDDQFDVVFYLKKSKDHPTDASIPETNGR